MRASGRPADAQGASPRSRSAVRRARIRRRRVVLLGALGLIVVGVMIGTRDPVGGAHGIVGSSQVPSDEVHALDPGYFAPGACTFLPPTKGDRHTTVFLDAGHGGIDPGGTGHTQSGTAISESTLTLPVELDAADLLRADGFSVVVSRTSNTTVLRLKADDVSDRSLTLVGSHDDTAARDVCANDAHASLLVGIYFDASSSSDNAGSLTGYDLSRPFWRDNARFAQLLQSDVLAAMNARGWQIPDDGALPDSGLGSDVVPLEPGSSLAAKAAAYDHLLLLGPAEAGYFGTPSQMPGALIEPLYLSDPFEGSIADSTLGQKTIAQGIAKAVDAYFAPPKRATPATAGA